MFGLPLAFAAPAALAALVLLAALYLFLKVTPPRPREVVFPPLRLLMGLDQKDATPARTPWPLLVLRIAIAALVVLAMAGPIWNALPAAGDRAAAADRRRRLAGGADLGAPRRLCARCARRRGALGAPRRPRADLARRARPRRRWTGRAAEERLRALEPVPYAPARLATLPPIQRFLAANPRAEVVWIADGIELGGAERLRPRARASGARPHVFRSSSIGRRRSASPAPTIAPARSQAHLTRAGADARRVGVVRALDAQGRSIAEAPFDFGVARAVDAKFDLPVELRNQVSRLVVADENLRRRDLAGRRTLAPAARRHSFRRERRRRPAAAVADLLPQAGAGALRGNPRSAGLRRAIRSSRCWPKSHR